jgi:glycosyltransferase 2 family protein
VTDEILEALWRQVGLLHRRARVAHRAFDAEHVVVDGTAPGIVDFGQAMSVAPVGASTDIVDLLLSTALLVGEERAVTGAAKGYGTDGLLNALPYMQPAVLSAGRRGRTGHRKVRSQLERLRAVIAEAAGVDPPHLQELHRVRPTNLLMAVGTLIGLAALLSRVGSPGKLWTAVSTAQWQWAVVAFALSMATNVTYALGLMGTVPVRLPLGASIELQVSMSFANLAIPVVGGTASQIRFLQKEGVGLASAVAAGGVLSTAANVVVSIGLLAPAIALSPDALNTNAIPVAGVARIVLLAVFVAGIVTLVIHIVPRLRRAVVPPIRTAMTTIAAAWRSPRQIALLVGGAVATNVLYTFCLLACLRAFDASVSFWTLLALSIFFGTVASLIPIPGGGAAVSSVGMSGALVGFGVPAVAAVAAVLLNQVVVGYLPAIPGWFATEDLIRRDYL